jgi:hypothetical protein
MNGKHLPPAGDILWSALAFHKDEPCARCSIPLGKHIGRRTDHVFIGVEDLQPPSTPELGV